MQPRFAELVGRYATLAVGSAAAGIDLSTTTQHSLSGALDVEMGGDRPPGER